MANIYSPGVTPSPVTVLSQVQSRFRIIKLGGEIRIIDTDDLQKINSPFFQGSVCFYKKPDGELLIKRFLETLSLPSDPKKVVADFWVNPSTFVYDSVAFSPLNTPATTLNYWTGYTAKPNPGNWSVIREFLLNVICAGDQDAYSYLLNYLAHMLQKPEEKPGVMIVMLGAQGTGKGTFFKLLRRIWTNTTLQVSDVDLVVGRFNAALELNYVVLMDEALFSGDKKSTEKLKSLITEPSIGIEQKHQPSRTIDSYHRFFAASNNDHFAHIDKDDRRMLFLRVSSDKKGDFEFFSKIFASIDQDVVIDAMVHDLLAVDLSTFNVRLRPKTGEHLRQKIQSLSGFERFWYEILVSEKFREGYHTLDWESSGVFISTESLGEAFKQYDKNAERYQSVQSTMIAENLERLCPSALKNRKSISGSQVRGYDLPDIDIARQEFERAVGGAMNWDWKAPAQDQPTPSDAYNFEGELEAYEIDQAWEMSGGDLVNPDSPEDILPRLPS